MASSPHRYAASQLQRDQFSLLFDCLGLSQSSSNLPKNITDDAVTAYKMNIVFCTVFATLTASRELAASQILDDYAGFIKNRP
jgi:hypothetical protein